MQEIVVTVTFQNSQANILKSQVVPFFILNPQIHLINHVSGGLGMDYRSYEKRLEYILELIQKNRLRSLEDIAANFDCSTRTIKRMLNHLRDQGHDIQYDRLQKKYFIKEKE